jgi:hypothetical protein
MPISDAAGAIVGGLWLYREYRLQKRSGIWDNVPVAGTIPEPVPADPPARD